MSARKLFPDPRMEHFGWGLKVSGLQKFMCIPNESFRVIWGPFTLQAKDNLARFSLEPERAQFYASSTEGFFAVLQNLPWQNAK